MANERIQVAVRDMFYAARAVLLEKEQAGELDPATESIEAMLSLSAAINDAFLTTAVETGVIGLTSPRAESE